MLRSKSICNKISFFFHSYFLFSKLCFICKRHKVNMSWYKELREKSPYINKDVHVFQIKTAHIESVANRQSHRCYASIPMDVFAIINVVTTQRHIFYADIIMDISTTANVITTQCRRCHASISMDIFAILYVVTTQRRMFYTGIPMDISNMMNTRTTQRRRCYAGIPMNTSITTNVLISQLGTSCAFDSPGLARNEPTLGKRSQGDSTP